MVRTIVWLEERLCAYSGGREGGGRVRGDEIAEGRARGGRDGYDG